MSGTAETPGPLLLSLNFKMISTSANTASTATTINPADRIDPRRRKFIARLPESASSFGSPTLKTYEPSHDNTTAIEAHPDRSSAFESFDAHKLHSPASSSALRCSVSHRLLHT